MSPAGFLIVGGGMAGAALALLLRHRGAEQVTLVEAVDLPDPDQPLSPSFDARRTALAAGTLNALDDIGLLDELLTQAADITTVHVSRAARPGITRIRAAEEGVPRLGAVMENRWLGQVLLRALAADDGIRVIAPDRVASLQRTPEGYNATLESGTELSTPLLVVADGAQSATRDKLGIAAHHQDTGEDALVANVVTEAPHEGVAFERFTDEGTVALLPMTEGRMAVVWSGTRERIRARETAEPETLLAELEGHFRGRLGRFHRVGTPARYPLVLTRAAAQAVPGAVVVGNAAHTLSPVAAQGFNLTLRDLVALADRAATAEAPGDWKLLRDWELARGDDQWAVATFSRHLAELFRKRGPLGHARQLGLAGLDLLPGPRHLFANRAMGLGRLSP
jgi:2-octaprenyl-6-methoxyphenol hydroxylase